MYVLYMRVDEIPESIPYRKGAGLLYDGQRRPDGGGVSMATHHIKALSLFVFSCSLYFSHGEMYESTTHYRESIITHTAGDRADDPFDRTAIEVLRIY